MTEPTRIVAIAGATGFVGRHVVERLLAEPGVQLRCLVRPSSDTTRLRAYESRVTLVEGDVCEPSTLPPLFEQAWGAINLAGYRDFWSQHRNHYYALNRDGAGHFFRTSLAANVSKVVHVSTPLAFGRPIRLPFDEETPAGPHPSDYARSKYEGDEIGWQLFRIEGLPLTIVHLAAVIGAGDPCPTMEIRRAVEKRLPALVGADTTYTYVYVRDAAEAIVRALHSPASIGRRYLIGTERATTRQYFELIAELANVPVPRLNLPERALIPIARILESVARRTGRRPALPVDILTTTLAGSLVFNGRRAQEELGMEYTPLRVALHEAVAGVATEAGREVGSAGL